MKRRSGRRRRRLPTKKWLLLPLRKESQNKKNCRRFSEINERNKPLRCFLAFLSFSKLDLSKVYWFCLILLNKQTFSAQGSLFLSRSSDLFYKQPVILHVTFPTIDHRFSPQHHKLFTFCRPFREHLKPSLTCNCNTSIFFIPALHFERCSWRSYNFSLLKWFFFVLLFDAGQLMLYWIQLNRDRRTFFAIRGAPVTSMRQMALQLLFFCTRFIDHFL